MHRNVIETVMGGVVLIVAAVFLVFVYSTSSIRTSSGYELSARFNRVDGVSPGTDVRLSGIKIGAVSDIELDRESYLAVLHMAIDNDVQLPTDSSAKITSDGLLGGTYLALEPGADEEMLAPGGEIRITQDPINIGDLIGRFIFSAAEKKAEEGAPAGEPEAVAPE
jgi:phospholipid/cholesterol/gamma-HCH transport system substrate-binding protein